MANFNKVILIGRFTRDPETRYLPSGTPTAEFALAVNRRWKDRQGELKEEVLFMECVAFGSLGETIAKHFKKGRAIQVEGHLKMDMWEAKDGSGKRSKIRTVVEGFSFVDGKSGTPQTESAGEESPAAEPATPVTPPARSRPAARNRRRDAKAEARPAARPDAAPVSEEIPI